VVDGVSQAKNPAAEDAKSLLSGAALVSLIFGILEMIIGLAAASIHPIGVLG